MIYRVVQEALTNVARHAGATDAHVRLTTLGHEARIVVEDNGRGIAPDASPHMGWLGMRERVTALGGQLAIGAAGAHGVRLDAQIPLEEAS